MTGSLLFFFFVKANIYEGVGGLTYTDSAKGRPQN